MEHQSLTVRANLHILKKLELFFLEKSKSHTYQLYDFNKRTSLYFLYLICLIGLLR
jgi:hypothetical protein